MGEGEDSITRARQLHQPVPPSGHRGWTPSLPLPQPLAGPHKPADTGQSAVPTQGTDQQQPKPRLGVTAAAALEAGQLPGGGGGGGEGDATRDAREHLCGASGPGQRSCCHWAGDNEAPVCPPNGHTPCIASAGTRQDITAPPPLTSATVGSADSYHRRQSESWDTMCSVRERKKGRLVRLTAARQSSSSIQ